MSDFTKKHRVIFEGGWADGLVQNSRDDFQSNLVPTCLFFMGDDGKLMENGREVGTKFLVNSVAIMQECLEGNMEEDDMGNLIMKSGHKMPQSYYYEIYKKNIDESHVDIYVKYIGHDF